MFRVFLPRLNRWIENIPAIEALVYKEEGYIVERMTYYSYKTLGREVNNEQP